MNKLFSIIVLFVTVASSDTIVGHWSCDDGTILSFYSDLYYEYADGCENVQGIYKNYQKVVTFRGCSFVYKIDKNSMELLNLKNQTLKVYYKMERK